MIFGNKSFGSRFGVLLPVTIMVAVLSFSPAAAQDPVMDFIIAADSIYKAGGEEALAGYVESNSILAGAAVHQLIDIAITVGDQGAGADEKENMEFAGLVARIYRDGGGNSAPLELVAVYRAWTRDRRKARAHAKSFEEQAAEARKAREFDKASSYFTRALKIYRQIGDSYSEAIVYGSYGVLYWYAGDFDAVFKYYEQALSLRRAIDNAILEGRTLNGLGSAHSVHDRFDSSEVYYRKAIDLRTRTGDLAGLGTSLTYLGNIYYRQGKLVAAREAFSEAAEVVNNTGNMKQQVDLLNSVANLYYEMGQIGRSSESYRQALEIAGALKPDDPENAIQSEISIRINIATNLIEEHRYRDALKQCGIAGDLLETSPQPQKSALYATTLFRIYMEMGEFDNAREYGMLYLQKAEELGASAMVMDAMHGIGWLYLVTGAYDRGIAITDSILVLADREDNREMARGALTLAAELEKERENYDASLRYWEKALEIDREEGSERGILIDELGIASIKAMHGGNAEAREKFRLVLPKGRSAGYDWVEEAVLLGIAHTFEQEDPDSARYYYEKALSVVERSAVQARSAELGSGMQSGARQNYYKEIARYYAGMAKKTGEEGWSSDAFRTVERAKARGLLDLMRNAVASEHSPQEEAVLDSIYSLDPGAESYRQDLEYLERRYRNIRDRRLESVVGGLDDAGDIAGLEEIQKAVPRKTAILSYSLGDEVSWLWVIDRKGHDLFELPGSDELRGPVTMFAQALRRPGAGDASILSAGSRLYSTLIEPGADRLKKAENIVIVPDGCLYEIPFEALVEGAAVEGGEWDEIPFLCRSHRTVYSPSASVFMGLRGKKKSEKYDLDLLAAGDPDYMSMESAESRDLRPLPNTKLEVEGIGAEFDDDARMILTGREASEAAIKAGVAGQPSRMLHIAAHGLVDPVTPTAPSIVLCALPGDGEDGYLHTLEILALPLESRLVVLSACETATGRISGGEGVVGLSRAFLGAGASAVVSSLWAVPDESTAKLMTVFYEKMKGKKRPAIRAMNEARLELLESGEYSHPFHWASFIVIGSDKAPW